MRIAVSGTHCVGKSTLIEEFLRRHPNFIHEPEPYEVLVEDYGEEFSAVPNVNDFQQQLQFNIERLQFHNPGDRVIYERCPADFLAYILALSRSETNSDVSLVRSTVEIVSSAVENLNLILYLPLKESDSPPDDVEYPALRRQVDAYLADILLADEFDIFSRGNVAIVEATGSTMQRLQTLEQAINR